MKGEDKSLRHIGVISTMLHGLDAGPNLLSVGTGEGQNQVSYPCDPRTRFSGLQLVVRGEGKKQICYLSRPCHCVTDCGASFPILAHSGAAHLHT